MSAVLKHHISKKYNESYSNKMWQLESSGFKNLKYGSKRFSPYDSLHSDAVRFCRSSGNFATAVPLPLEDDTPRGYCLSIPDDHSEVIIPSCVSNNDDDQPLDLRVDSRKRKLSEASSEPSDDLECHGELRIATPLPPPLSEPEQVPAELFVQRPPSTPFVEPQVLPSGVPLASPPLSAPVVGFQGYKIDKSGHVVLPSLVPKPTMEHQGTTIGQLASPPPGSPPSVRSEDNVVAPTVCSPVPSAEPATEEQGPSTEHQMPVSFFIDVAADPDEHFKQSLGASVFASVQKAIETPPLKRMRFDSVSPSNTSHDYPAPAYNPKRPKSSTSSNDSVCDSSVKINIAVDDTIAAVAPKPKSRRKRLPRKGKQQSSSSKSFRSRLNGA